MRAARMAPVDADEVGGHGEGVDAVVVDDEQAQGDGGLGGGGDAVGEAVDRVRDDGVVNQAPVAA